jgi:hypothetical protein
MNWKRGPRERQEDCVVVERDRMSKMIRRKEEKEEQDKETKRQKQGMRTEEDGKEERKGREEGEEKNVWKNTGEGEEKNVGKNREFIRFPVGPARSPGFFVSSRALPSANLSGEHLSAEDKRSCQLT